MGFGPQAILDVPADFDLLLRVILIVYLRLLAVEAIAFLLSGEHFAISYLVLLLADEGILWHPLVMSLSSRSSRMVLFK